MTYLSVENLSKSFGEKVLFEQLTFGISKGDKTALVAPNGTGKSTLLRVLAGLEPPDEGQVMTQNEVRVSLLEQEPELEDSLTIQEYITQGQSDVSSIIRRYEDATQAQAESFTPETQAAFEAALTEMETAGAWDYEQRMQQILGRLDITQLDQPISTLSGGERKRVALAFVLLENPDLLLLDEPTNHLDLEMIEWLEQYLAQSSTTLLMITHDRYFLDRICTHILEIDNGQLYHHKGNYDYYLQKKNERKEVEQTKVDKAGQLLKKELDWLRRSPKARTGKSKSRISAIDKTAEVANRDLSESEIKLDVNMQRMGSKIIELSRVNKRFGDKVILEDFSYSFQRGERIGIIGKNGTGKSTFLNILTGESKPDSGTIDQGSTIAFGHYQQQGIQLDENKRVIELLEETAKVIQLSDGTKLSASRFLEHFMFPPDLQYTHVASLSGGERRRLALMLVLLKNPNFLILDEPTNDLDLPTLQRLEEFLLSFGGCLIIVSHDRFFMDKLVQHYLIFEGDGDIRSHHGTYLEYRDIRKNEEAKQNQRASQAVSGKKKASNPNRSAANEAPNKKKGLSYKEKKEQKRLEREIETIESEQEEIEEQLQSGELEYDVLTDLSEQYRKLDQQLEEVSTRWLELAEKDS